MATSCPAGFDTAQLMREISFIYERVADDPSQEFHFHRGPAYAVRQLGYDAAELAALPSESTASFAGVANPLAIEPIEPGQTVLDIGCGAGMDLLLAAQRVGAKGRAIGVDMTEAMLERTRDGARSLGFTHVDARLGDAHDLPVDDDSVDVVITNGVLNLSPDKERAFSEVARVLRPGGRLMLADIAVHEELSEKIRNNIDLWTG